MPEGVNSIGSNAFTNCTDLTAITIPNSVTSIESNAFSSCTSIMSVKSYITEPFNVTGLFSNETYRKGSLYVPAGTKELYIRFDGWQDFLKIEEMDDTPIPDPDGELCATPTITFVDGKLKFSCSTEDVEYVYEIKDTDIKKGYDSEVTLSATYEISVYATKEGWANSNVATATLVWGSATFTEDTNMTTSVKTLTHEVPALVTSHRGIIAVQSESNGLPVAVYTTDGRLHGSSIIKNGKATISTNIQAGNIAIVKIGNKAVKVMVK